MNFKFQYNFHIVNKIHVYNSTTYFYGYYFIYASLRMQVEIID